MTITLYKTEIRPEMNAVVESISKYLSDDKKVYQWTNVKYTKPELDIMVKLPLDGSINSLKQFDYAVLYDETSDRKYYYFVVNMDWKAKMTLRLQLSMDTLTTFWGAIREGLTQNTHVTRRYFDRWKRVGTKLYPLIDEHPEDITQPYMLRSGKPVAIGDHEHWTLAYITEYDGNDVAKNPVSCLALPDDGKPMDGTLPNSMNYGSLPDMTLCVLDHAHAPNAVISWNGGSYSFSSSSAKAALLFQHQSKTIAIRHYDGNDGWSTTSVSGNATITGTSVIYKQPSNFKIDMDSQYWQFDDPINFLGTELPSFAKWFESHKTDPRLVKIMELPYAPFKVEYTSSGNMKVPTGWEMSAEGALRLKDGVISFKSDVQSFDRLGPDPIDYSTISASTAADPLKYETKLWNSNYHTIKFAYDGNAHDIRLENYPKAFSLPEAVPEYNVSIIFQSSTGMDNSTMFFFKSPETVDSDFGEYLVCNRNTEIGYYSSDYLHYLRFGKAVDDRNFGWKTASTLTSGIGSTIQTSASLAFAVAGAKIGSLTGGFGAAVGAGVGLVTSLIATSASISQSRDQINAKIDNYTHQASSVSAASDLSLFRAYGKNKLLKIEYEPHYDVKKAIGRYFELYGYSCDEYGIPNWNTRIWSNYFVMEPDFISDTIFKDYEQDIRTRMQSGFRVLHYYQDARPAGPIDFENQYENWERSFIQ